jgi:hypothetical protein
MATLRNLVINILRLAGYVSVAAALRHATPCDRSACSQAANDSQ